MRILSLILAFCLVMPLSAYAASVAVVDAKAIMSSSLAAQSIQTQRDALRERYVAEISEKEQGLRSFEASLKDAQGKLPEEEVLSMKQDYETRLLETRRLAQNNKRNLEQASQKATARLRDVLYKVVQEIANEKKYDLVISNQNVIAGHMSLDITQETLARLNEALPSIELEVE